MKTNLMTALIFLGLAGCGQGPITNPTPPPIVVDAEIAALDKDEERANQVLTAFRKDWDESLATDTSPDFDTTAQSLESIYAGQLQFTQGLEAKRLALLEGYLSKMHRSHQARLLEVEGRRVLFLLGQWQDLLSELRAVSGKAVNDDGTLTGSPEPPKPEELEAIRDRLRQEFADHQEFVELHLGVMEEAATQPLIQGRVFFWPYTQEEKEKLSQSLATLGEENPQFTFLFDALDALWDLDQDYYFSLGSMEFLEPEARDLANEQMKKWRERFTEFGETLYISFPLEDLSSLSDLFN